MAALVACGQIGDLMVFASASTMYDLVDLSAHIKDVPNAARMSSRTRPFRCGVSSSSERLERGPCRWTRSSACSACCPSRGPISWRPPRRTAPAARAELARTKRSSEAGRDGDLGRGDALDAAGADGDAPVLDDAADGVVGDEGRRGGAARG